MKPIALFAFLSLAACAGTQTADTTAKVPDCREVATQLNAKKECPHHKDGKCDCKEGGHEDCEGH